MPLTKKQQAEFDALRKEILRLKAWRQTEECKPDIPPPQDSGYSFGHWAHSYISANWRVEDGAASSVSHYTGSAAQRLKSDSGSYPGSYVSGSQRPIWLFSTRLRALRHIRYELEQRMLDELAKIDAEIEAEQAQGGAQ